MKNNKHPLIIAHRGNGNEFPENTIEACEKALASGAEALEIDVRYCADGELVVFHDAKLKRLLNVKKSIWMTSLKELKKYPFVDAPLQIRVPTLEEFLEHFKNSIPINLDLKTWWPFVGQFSRDVVRVMKRVGNIEQLWVSSFNPLLLKTIMFNTERILTGYLFQRWPEMHQKLDLLWKSTAWHPHHSLLDASFIEQAKRQNKKLYTWTVNSEEEMRQLICADHIKGIITDNPTLLSSLVQQ
jgi:glycerophosphoryl diester phosphodiesterase